MPVRVRGIELIDIQEAGDRGAPVPISGGRELRRVGALLVAGAREVGDDRAVVITRRQNAAGVAEGAGTHQGDAGDADDGSCNAGRKRGTRAPWGTWLTGPANQPPHGCAHLGEPPTHGGCVGSNAPIASKLSPGSGFARLRQVHQPCVTEEAQKQWAPARGALCIPSVR